MTIGKDLIKAAKEARAYARGDADLSEYEIHVPASIDVKSIRKDLGLTQKAFAARYGFTVSAIRDYEQRRSNPEGHTRAYLLVIKKETEAVERALAAA